MFIFGYRLNNLLFWVQESKESLVIPTKSSSDNRVIIITSPPRRVSATEPHKK